MNGCERENGRAPRVPYAHILDLGVSDVRMFRQQITKWGKQRSKVKTSEEKKNKLT